MDKDAEVSPQPDAIVRSSRLATAEGSLTENAHTILSQRELGTNSSWAGSQVELAESIRING